MSSAAAYAAFISYRHTPDDRAWAVWAQRTIENYRVPARLRKRYAVGARLGKVFRDDDEMPTQADLGSAIDASLRQARFLVVICSPRLPESRWCAAELQHFLDRGEVDRVILVLTEGTPDTAFPTAIRSLTRAAPAGGEARPWEPIAADVRPRPDESNRRVRFRAASRIRALVIGCSLDELIQRELRRRRQRIALLAAAACVMLAIVATLSGGWSGARQQRDLKARQQTVLKLAQAAGDLSLTDPDAALDAARRAWLMDESTGSENRSVVDAALRTALDRQGAPWRVTPGEGRLFMGGAMSDDGRFRVASTSSASALTMSPGMDIWALQRDTDKRRANLGKYAPSLMIWDGDTGSPRVVPLPDFAGTVCFYAPTKFACVGFGGVTF